MLQTGCTVIVAGFSGSDLPIMTTADLIITNAGILTLDGKRPHAEALAITGNRIAALGSNAEIAAWKGKATRIIDAQGNSAMPGIVESHIHLFPGGVELESLMVTGIEGIDALTKAVRNYAKSRPDDAIIVANGANYTAIRPDSTITRQDLDRILPDRPFMMACFDHHTVWANTVALKAAGLLKGKTLPPGNEIVMAADGLASGELKEIAAFGPLFAMTPTQGREGLGMATGEGPQPPATAAQREADKLALKRGLSFCASLGITSIHNMDGNWYQLELLDSLRKEGTLTARVQVPWHQKNTMALETCRRSHRNARQVQGRHALFGPREDLHRRRARIDDGVDAR